MSYVVLARRLRPTRFADLIGQESIVQALQNSIRTNRVAHSFLFTGSRGVGKTSAARILAKTLNCLAPQDANPCLECSNCTDIQLQASPDVLELDAASNRGIEHIRELRENVKYRPANSRYKVYIIDEVHMLTIESFNALLKTLEEPPAHIKFILATTDPHKIPQTILSRCQRYDFVRIPLKKMTDYLEQISQQEGFSFSRTGLELLAKQSIGGMRDALTAMDQVVSYTAGSITEESVSTILGVMGPSLKIGLLQSIFQKNPAAALEQFRQIHQQGHDFQNLLTELLHAVRSISLIQVLSSKNSPHLFQELSQEEWSEYQKMAMSLSGSELQQIFQSLLRLEGQLKQSQYAQVCFEMALLHMTSVQPLQAISELIEQIRILQKGTVVLPIEPSRIVPQGVASAPLNSLKNQLVSSSHPPLNPIGNQKNFVKSVETLAEKNTPSHAKIPDSNAPAEARIDRGENQDILWIEFVQQKSPRLGSFLKNALISQMKGPEITLTFKAEGFLSMLSDDHIRQLSTLASEFHQRPVRVVVKQTLSGSPEELTVSEKSLQFEETERQRKQILAQEEPQVQSILEIFPQSHILKIQTE